MTKPIYTDKNYFDQRFGSLDEAISSIHGMLEKHGERITVLEGFRGQLIFFVGVVMAVITFLGDAVKKRLGIT